MLAIVQRLDPPGTGTRDLRECLLIQMREKKVISRITHLSPGR